MLRGRGPLVRRPALGRDDASFTTSNVTSIAVTPAGVSFVIAFTGEGVFRSGDHGHTRAMVNKVSLMDTAEHGIRRCYSTVFAVEPEAVEREMDEIELAIVGVYRVLPRGRRTMDPWG